MLRPNKYPGIPDPAPNVEALHTTVLALKEAVELLTNQRAGGQPPVTWSDLTRLNIVSEADVPK